MIEEIQNGQEIQKVENNNFGKEIAEYIKKELEERGRCIISGVGVFEILPTRKGRHFNLITREWADGTLRKWRVKFKPTPVFNMWLKGRDFFINNYK